jgi:hypothetical protein
MYTAETSKSFAESQPSAPIHHVKALSLFTQILSTEPGETVTPPIVVEPPDTLNSIQLDTVATLPPALSVKEWRTPGAGAVVVGEVVGVVGVVVVGAVVVGVVVVTGEVAVIVVVTLTGIIRVTGTVVVTVVVIGVVNRNVSGTLTISVTETVTTVTVGATVVGVVVVVGEVVGVVGVVVGVTVYDGALIIPYLD